MIRQAISAFLLLTLCSPALAQSTCNALSETVESQLKKSALSWAEGIGDNSVPRATLREIEISNALAIARMNLDLMAYNKCPGRIKPVNPMIYMNEALDCNLQRLKEVKDAPACNMQDWKGLSPVPDKKVSGS